MIDARDTFSLRLTRRLTRLIALYAFSISLALIALTVSLFSSQVATTQNFLDIQLRNEIMRISSYGELIQIQPFLSSSLKGIDSELDTFLSIEQKNSGSIIAYAGVEPTHQSIFERTHVDQIEVPVLGSILIKSSFGYERKIAHYSAFLLLIFATFIGLTLLFRRKIQFTISSQSVGIDELESVVDGLMAGNDRTTDGRLGKAIGIVKGYTEKQAQLLSAEKFTLLARQVSHDIRSPVSALKIFVKNLDHLNEDHKQLARAATDRIINIANSLLSTKHPEICSDSSLMSAVAAEEKALSATDVKNVVRSIVSEKQAQYLNLDTIKIFCSGVDGESAYAMINKDDFSRALSNLLNNAVEAIEDAGIVNARVETSPDRISISIEDNGKGMPESLLNKIGQIGLSTRKPGTDSGSGLGVFQAKSAIESSGGDFRVQSTVNLGTTVYLSFKRI